MKRLSLVWIVIVLINLVAGPLEAKPLTDGEREKLVEHLEASRQALLDSTAGLSKAQWSFKPADDVWSVGECAEHLALAEQLIHGNVVEILQSEPAEATAAKEEMVMKGILDRSQKFQAPAPVNPAEKTADQLWGGKKKATMKAFSGERAKVLELVADAKDLRSYVGPHPAFGELDAYTWLIFLSGHTQRHIAQIEEVKANPGFPAK